MMEQLVGKEIKRIQPKEGLQQTTIDIFFLSAGVYLISYKQGGQRQLIKFIKQ